MSEEQLRQKIVKSLNYDPLSEAERVTGRRYNEDGATALLGFEYLQQNILRKRSMLGELGDTYYGIGWDQFLSIVSAQEFEVVHKERLVEEIYDGIVVSPTVLIAAHRQKKLLLIAKSSVPVDPRLDQTLNDGRVYGSLDISGDSGHENVWQKIMRGGFSVSFYGEKIEFYYDAAEALVTKLELLESVGTLCDWPHEYEYIFLQRQLQHIIQNVPGWVLEFMGIEIDNKQASF